MTGIVHDEQRSEFFHAPTERLFRGNSLFYYNTNVTGDFSDKIFNAYKTPKFNFSTALPSLIKPTFLSRENLSRDKPSSGFILLGNICANRPFRTRSIKGRVVYQPTHFTIKVRWLLNSASKLNNMPLIKGRFFRLFNFCNT